MEEEVRVLKDRPLLVQAGTQTAPQLVKVCVVGDSDTGVLVFTAAWDQY